jgi:hypothetical protein
MARLSEILGQSFGAPQGFQGVQGVQGLQGVGSQGIQGPSGISVNQGAQGLQGLQGLQATQGTQGLQGLSGLFAGQGVQGASGNGGGGGTTIGITTDSSSSNTNVLFVTETGTSGIATLKTNPSLLFDASNTRLGIGTISSPQFTVDVTGDVRVRASSKVRFGGTSSSTNYYIQYNSSSDSLDFISG